MKINPIDISSSINSKKYDFDFSIFTLVNDSIQYNEFLESCDTAGFTNKNTEFCYLNNKENNLHDGFTGLNKAIHIAKGRYIILAHQDIRLNFDGIEVLKKRIAEMENKDPHWGILGNAGGNFDLGEKFIRISDPNNKNLSFGTFPAVVNSLDENFLVLKSSSLLAFSNDMQGFHFYGTDICQQAIFRGFSCYVIDFHILHLSSGNKNENYFESKQRFINNYQRKLSARFLRTTTTRLYLSGSRFLNFLFNKINILFILRKTKFYKLISLRS
jgi:hypothetical protein